LRRSFTAAPSFVKSQARVRAPVTNRHCMDSITVSARVTAPDPELARVSIGRRQFSIGRPLELDELSPRVAAIEYALGAIGGEVVNGLRVFANRRRLPVDAVEAVVTGELEHGLTYLEVVGEQEPPRLARIHVKVFAATDEPAAVRALFGHMLERLPLVCTLRAALALTIELAVTS